MGEGEGKPHSELHEAAKRLGRAGGKKGGPARARVLSQQERSEIAAEGGRAKAAKEEFEQRKKTAKKKGKRAGPKKGGG